MRDLKRWVLLAGSLTVLLAGPASAEASYNPVAAGSIKLRLSASFTSVLNRNQVKLRFRGGAYRSGNAIVIPAAGGEFDPRLGLGTVEGRGTILFEAGNRRIPFRKLVFKSKRAPIYARVGGGQLKVATGAKVTVNRAGFGIEFTARGLDLTPKVATRLNKKLRLGQALQPGQEIGTVAASASPATVHLRQGDRLQLQVDPAFAAKLDERFVSLNPIAPAELAPGPALTFPVGTDSTLSPDGQRGTVKVEGQVELLQLGSSQVFWRELWLQPETASLLTETEALPSPPNAGKLPQGQLLGLPPGALVSSEPGPRVISISGQAATLSSAGAATLNQAFAEGSPDFAAGELVGAISLRATAE
jgi:hypothetical protein